MPKQKASATKKTTTSRVGSGTKRQVTEGEVELFLTPVEMAEMDNLMLVEKVKALEAVVEHAEVDKHVLRIQKLQVELELKRLKLQQANHAITEQAAKRASYVEEVKAKYHIQAPRWSYIPITGKILLEE